ncbi:hypothetical protein HDU67_005113 [Dinochytrium kinnereticum]|nr:hypothetical protein HDU67_005113 [Dinochytrium kinnereticum]
MPSINAVVVLATLLFGASAAVLKRGAPQVDLYDKRPRPQGQTLLQPREHSLKSRDHNGTIITGPINFYTIYYGREWNETDSRIPIIEDFLNNIGQTPWWNTVREYNSSSGFHAGTRVHPVKGQHIDRGSFGMNFTDGYDSQTPQSWPQVINTAITRQNWTIDPNNTIFVIVADSNVSDSTLGGFCNGVCGYHSAFRHPQAPFPNFIPWIIVQSPDFCPPCRPRRFFFGGSPNDNVAADSIVNTIAHQLAETVTDPLYDAWYFDGELSAEGTAEMSNPCEWKFTGVQPNGTNENAWNHIVGPRRYLIQDLWSVTNQSCVGKTNVYMSDSNFQQLWSTNITVTGNVTAELPSAALANTYPDLNSTKITLNRPSLRLEDDGTLSLLNKFGRPVWIANAQPNLTYFESLSTTSGGISSIGGGISSSNGTFILGLNSTFGLNIDSWKTGPIAGPEPLVAILRPDASIAIISSDNHVQAWSGPLTVRYGYEPEAIVGHVTEEGFFEVWTVSDKNVLWRTGDFKSSLPPGGVVFGTMPVLTTNGGCALRINGTGNLEVVDSQNTTLWSSNTSIANAAEPFAAGLTDDGIFKVMDADGQISFTTDVVARYDPLVCYPVLMLSNSSVSIKFVSSTNGDVKDELWSVPFSRSGSC